MALLHRDRDTTTDDTVSGPTPTWPTSTPTDTVPERTVVRKNSFGQTLRTILATVSLAPGESARDWFGDKGVAVANGVRLDWISGTIDGVVYTGAA